MENLNLEALKFQLERLRGKGVVLDYSPLADDNSVMVNVSTDDGTKIIQIHVQDDELNGDDESETVGTANLVNTDDKVDVTLAEITEGDKLSTLLVYVTENM